MAMAFREDEMNGDRSRTRVTYKSGGSIRVVGMNELFIFFSFFLFVIKKRGKDNNYISTLRFTFNFDSINKKLKYYIFLAV